MCHDPVDARTALFLDESDIDQLVGIITELGTPTRDQLRTTNYMEFTLPDRRKEAAPARGPVIVKQNNHGLNDSLALDLASSTLEGTGSCPKEC